MSGGLRQAMTVLHTWGGLVLGWVLMAIFVAGTLAVFSPAITHWMSGEAASAPDAPIDRQAAIAAAGRFLAAAKTGDWRIEFPNLPGARLAIWTGDDWEEDKPPTLVDPETGAIVAPGSDAARAIETGMRETAGGYHFIRFHYALHAGIFGIYIVGIATAAMLLAIVTGVIIHKRIFKDFFTLRFGKGQRSWLDGHNVASVLTLPFQVMIAYTGLAIFHYAWMPAAIAFHFGLPGGIEGQFDHVGPYFEARHRVDAAVPAAGVESVSAERLPILAAEAERMSAGRAFLGADRAIDEHGVVRFRLGVEPDPTRLPSDGVDLYQVADASGRLIPEPMAAAPGTADTALDVMANLHFASFGGLAARWLWFLCGTAGCVMIATGLVLFTVKRRQRSRNEFGAATPHVFRVIEALNVGSIAGVLLASIAYFWANRIIPAGVPDRATMEIACFLLLWAATPVHALLRPVRRAWIEQLGLAALLAIALPLVNAATTGNWFATYAVRADWTAFGVEIVAVAFGIALALTTMRIARSPA